MFTGVVFGGKILETNSPPDAATHYELTPTHSFRPGLEPPCELRAPLLRGLLAKWPGQVPRCPGPSGLSTDTADADGGLSVFVAHRGAGHPTFGMWVNSVCSLQPG